MSPDYLLNHVNMCLYTANFGRVIVFTLINGLSVDIYLADFVLNFSDFMLNFSNFTLKKHQFSTKFVFPMMKIQYAYIFLVEKNTF